MLVSRSGICSSSHPWASAAGVEMLLRGGNAVDAAVATGFAVAVCEPAWSHLEGRGVMLVHMVEERRTVALDFYACPPASERTAIQRSREWSSGVTQRRRRGCGYTLGVLAISTISLVITSSEGTGRDVSLSDR